ncbi:MAG: hypothetical protein IAE79_21820 [Anaerolinea sp.]|nr:hypothetical protein [Anaerolinea sp.]
MITKSKWTPLFLLLAAFVMAITPTAGSLAVITWVVSGLFLILAAVMLWSQPMKTEKKAGRLWQILFIVGLLLTMALFGFLRYRPALMAAPDYALHNVTEPGWLSGRIKAAQVIIEQTPCTYALLGWQEDGILYYTADCAGNSQTWRYTAATQHTEIVTQAPTGLYAETAPLSSIVDGVLADVYPRELTTVSRGVFIVGDVLPSPDGRFIAVVSRHIYGPQDVLLLTPPSPIFTPEPIPTPTAYTPLPAHTKTTQSLRNGTSISWSRLVQSSEIEPI